MKYNMHYLIAFGVFYVLEMVVIISWAYEQSHEFHSMKSDNGEVLCTVSPPNKTLSAVRSRIECALSCSADCASPCHTVNFWKKAKLCQQFYYLPSSYEAKQDCVSYQVTL